MGEFFQGIADSLSNTLVVEGRWRLYATGFLNSIAMVLMAAAIGIILGTLVAIAKTHYAHTGKGRVLNWICNLYTTVIRGTPIVLQLLIFYYFVFRAAPLNLSVLVAGISFGINSGAYVSEIIRAGIMSVDIGQTEAGRSLGLSQRKTMRLIVLPQAVRNILPALFNELIALLKETSVAGYISISEITRASDLIRSRTFEFTPLIISALIYLALVYALTKVQKVLERRMALK